MALNYDVSAVKNWQKLNPGITQCMVFATMFVGMGEITVDNAPRFAARLDAWQKLKGAIMRRAVKSDKADTYYGKDIPLGIDQVRRYIGLRCNVGYETPAQFSKRLLDPIKKDW